MGLAGSLDDRTRLAVGLVQSVEPGIGVRLHQSGIAGQMLFGMLAAMIARIEEHRRRLLFASAFISADTVNASTGPVIRIRPPVANSISITSALSGKGRDTSASGAIATRSNAAGTRVGSHNC